MKLAANLPGLTTLLDWKAPADLVALPDLSTLHFEPSQAHRCWITLVLLVYLQVLNRSLVRTSRMSNLQPLNCLEFRMTHMIQFLRLNH